MGDFSLRLINGTRNPTQPTDRGINMLEWATVIIAAAIIAGTPGMSPIDVADDALAIAQTTLDGTE